MQEASFVALGSAVLGGLVSGGVAVWGALRAVRAGVADLEANERRRQKIACVINLYGLRFVLGPDGVSRDEDRARYMFEIGRAGGLFADDNKVQMALRNFRAEVENQSKLKQEIATRQQAGMPGPQDAALLKGASDRTTDSLVAVIRELSRSAHLPLENLSESEIKAIFMVPLWNPGNFPVVISNSPSTPTSAAAGGQPSPFPPQHPPL